MHELAVPPSKLTRSTPTMEDVDGGDDDGFWSVAMLPPTDNLVDYANETVAEVSENNDHDEDIVSSTSTQSFTVLPPDPSQNPLALVLQMNCNDGILSDVSGIPWDAGLLLSGFLCGTHEGRQLCYDACFRSIGGVKRGGGILELGSGLGMVGLAAASAALSVRASKQGERDDDHGHIRKPEHETSVLKSKETSDTSAHTQRVVLTDRNSDEILSNLRKNVRVNLDRVAEASRFGRNDSPTSKSTIGGFSITVEPCDWTDLSGSLRIDANSISERPERNLPTNEHHPRGPFNMILGSALVYLPEHAAACADTLFHYMTFANDEIGVDDPRSKRQAIILQLPDRAGFATYFLPRCRELGLAISCRELEKELVERVQMGWTRKISSAGDYRLYFITTE